MIGKKAKVYYKGTWINGQMINYRFSGNGTWHYIIESVLTGQLMHVSSDQKEVGIYLLEKINEKENVK